MAEGDGDEAMPTAKKARTPRKAKTPAKVNAGVDSEEDASKSAEPESGGVGEQVTGVAEGEEMAVWDVAGLVLCRTHTAGWLVHRLASRMLRRLRDEFNSTCVRQTMY